MRAVDRLPQHQLVPPTGAVVQSICGHDRGRLYLVTDTVCLAGVVYLRLCDGRLRGLSNPKKKNSKHVRMIQAGAGQAESWLSDMINTADQAAAEAAVRKLLKTLPEAIGPSDKKVKEASHV
ncbi:hypothetical protein HCH52_07170 [Oscillospiraceae bacterium HV4-5-C5C]|nr:hypothetical protein [Oscillospiraceae bacterium HV4-5-C5C]